jgi:5-methylcytosine-specific restriction enzyme subunit McrC
MTIAVFEYDMIAKEGTPGTGPRVPARVFTWLETQSLQDSEDKPRWLRPAICNGKRAVKVTNYAGVVRAPCGFQIEVLPKTGKATSIAEARSVLLRMLSCLGEFRHVRLNEAHLMTRPAPLLDAFIAHFLDAVDLLVRQGLRGGYASYEEDLIALRGKLAFSRHIRNNLTRRDRFSVEHDDFRFDRPENRLILTAIDRVRALTNSSQLKRQARLLAMPFDGIPQSRHIAQDIQASRIERDMQRYQTPLAWARLILQHLAPLTGSGDQWAPSLLYPMEALFEAYVYHHLSRQLPPGYKLKKQACSEYLTTHKGQRWFQLKPDLLLIGPNGTEAVLDTKWKLLDASKGDNRSKYGLSQADFYQLYAYGQHYLSGNSKMALVYPQSDNLAHALAPFNFPRSDNVSMSIEPFCLDDPKDSSDTLIDSILSQDDQASQEAASCNSLD